MERILKDTQERRQCRITLKGMHKQMTKSYSMAVRGPNKPAWVTSPDREKKDVLKDPFWWRKSRGS